jgi:endogenous inhibitor of DNA gyrase (YacG/DUF329 family)
MKICQICKKEYKEKGTKGKGAKYCSIECAHQALMVIKICLQCKKEYRGESKKYCSRKCYTSARTGITRIVKGGKHIKVKIVDFICPICEKVLRLDEKKAIKRIYCSNKCQSKVYSQLCKDRRETKNQRLEIECKTCKKIFVVNTIESDRRIFCSKRCQGMDGLVRATKKTHCIVPCLTCGKDIEVIEEYKDKKRYCSKKCLYNRDITKENRENLSNGQVKRFLKNDFLYKGYHFSVKNNAMMGYRSNDEKICMELFDQMNELDYYTCEKDSVPYLDERGIKRHTLPDFHLYWKSGYEQIIEYKPGWKMQFERELLKLKADEKYCKSKGWKFSVWSEKNIGL